MARLIPRTPCLWLCLLGGLASTALSETRHPVISKVEIVFSMVSHHNHIQDRVFYYDSQASPQGNTNYAVPHLVYEPAVTLYNPYNEPLTMDRSRIRIWDPPVGFAFKKNDVFVRDEFAAGQFHGLARFQIEHVNNPDSRKFFTLSLSSPTEDGQPGGSIVIPPGGSQTFSTWVEDQWTWGLETAGGYAMRSFLDWSANNNFTNVDGRTRNSFGVEAISSPFPHSFTDWRAGFQTDKLSVPTTRPAASLYDFELAGGRYDPFVVILLSDTVTVQAKAMRTNPVPSGADFQVDLLQGQVANPASDQIKSFPLSLDGIIQNDAEPVTSRTYQVGDILQTPNDLTPGGKSPFAAITMIAKTSALRANRFYSTPAVPTSDLYELHFTEIAGFGDTLLTPSDAPTGGLEVQGFSRSGETLFIDFSGAANPHGLSPGTIRGTSSLEDGFPDDLSHRSTVMASQSGSGIYKAIIDISGLGDRYFVRIEE